ncbi:MAG: hypothetical protein ACJAU5_001688, partial [Maricaulis maris]
QVGEVRIEAASRNSLSGSLTGSKRSAA